MHKRKVGRTFSRKRGSRRAFMRSLLRSLVLRGNMHTTDARAREIRGMAERLVTHAKKGTIASRRYLVSEIGGDASLKLVNDLAPLLKSRQGGYTRIYKKEARKSDGARLALIEFV